MKKRAKNGEKYCLRRKETVENSCGLTIFQLKKRGMLNVGLCRLIEDKRLEIEVKTKDLREKTSHNQAPNTTAGTVQTDRSGARQGGYRLPMLCLVIERAFEHLKTARQILQKSRSKPIGKQSKRTHNQERIE